MTSILVGDDSDVRQVIGETIAEAGHEVACIGTFAEARAELILRRHQLLITDIRLPDGSGYVLAERAERMGMQALLMTAFADEAETARMTARVQLRTVSCSRRSARCSKVTPWRRRARSRDGHRQDGGGGA